MCISSVFILGKKKLCGTGNGLKKLDRVGIEFFTLKTLGSGFLLDRVGCPNTTTFLFFLGLIAFSERVFYISSIQRS